MILTCSLTQVDFGRDPLNRQILTLTNLEGDIFCASHGRPFTLTYQQITSIVYLIYLILTAHTR